METHSEMNKKKEKKGKGEKKRERDEGGKQGRKGKIKFLTS